MIIKNIQIHVILLLLGIFSMQSTVFDSFSSSFFVAELEVEESNEEIGHVDFVEKSLDYGSGSGGNAILPAKNPLTEYPLVKEFNLIPSESKDLSQKPQLFILYCCLKIDC